ncbi:N-6 DNA methylase [Microcoleus sp. FACHB-1515]|uniref:Eco57I restriction-modification methylase domain-containing protein n=1 Tax=Cyanophyceae TaxID=3028117 RepID=UPI0016889CD0|nr:DNA methyltransferase [Microcoleus sp. FACHB-1515]MBD2090661.1 N-6 DNA methylase [Microcoleus sp. FACHB-1515]
MAADIDILRHKEWLGLLQPVGLVVSPPALIKAQAVIDRGKLVDLQERLQVIVSIDTLPRHKEKVAWVEFSTFARSVLGWRDGDLVGLEALPESLTVALPSYGELLKPSYAVCDPDSDQWILLIQEVKLGLPFDEDDPAAEAGHGWKASIQAKFERLLRETGVFAGLLVNGTEIRLVYAPSGESSGHLTFPIQAMTEVPGRSILGAIDLLLGDDRLFNVPDSQRLRPLLEESRSYQAEVSTKLSGQVLDALWELLRGFQAADAAVNGKLLRELAAIDPQHIYGGLITTLMRLVFLLYAEDEGLMPDDEVYQRHYAVSGLYEKLREDAGNYPDTIDQRYGAWAALLSLFRLVYDGGGANAEYLPARRGQLFNPDEYPYLEGRSIDSHYATAGRLEAPRISDGVIYRMLDKLLILDGERLSYRSLDVEQIGSVYEAIMGYEVEISRHFSIGISSRPKGSKVTTTIVIDLQALLEAKPIDRAKLLKESANCELSAKAAKELKAATHIPTVVAALSAKISHRTRNVLPPGSLYLQPTEERRRSGSHYTPRKLTQPIVEKTLEPVLMQLGTHPTPAQLLDLKVCDLAMGSAAFLVEACRQLGDRLVEAWNYHGKPDNLLEAVEDVVVARRLVAQRCLYGVDKNPFAVNLARLSLWLVTLAKDLPFTFLDHALKCGDSLVGLTRSEIGSFGASAAYEPTFFEDHKRLMRQSAAKALAFRQEIQTADTRTDDEADRKQALLQDVNHALAPARLTAQVAIASFFAGTNAKQRQHHREEFGGKLIGYEKGLVSETDIAAIVSPLTTGAKTVLPFCWELEFPEVFDRLNPGFDAIVGNPPFAGKNTTINGNVEGYLDWLKIVHPEAHGNADLVAHFFRRSFTLLRKGGALGLIATNTIAQGDTRSTGLRFICQNGGTIYHAQKRVKWPGLAAVVVSVVNIFKGNYSGIKILNGRSLEKITAFLFHDGGHENPIALRANANKSFQGSIVLGMGFTFDDTNPNATSIAQMHELIAKDPRNADRIFPYIGGEEVNSSPTHAHHRYVINFGEMKEDEARKYPDLMAIVEEKVKPERDRLGGNADAKRRKEKWWLWGRYTPALFRAIAQCDRVLVCGIIGKHLSFAFLPSKIVYSHKLAVFPLDSYSSFAILQSNIHGIWAWFFSSTMKDDLNYSNSDCFETFPFPEDWELDRTLESIGKTYYEFRADLMVRNDQGLTETYNRFHDPDEIDPDILQLRSLHEQIDRAVLDAYGWHDIPTKCEFLLDYEDEDPEGSSKRKKPWRYRWPEDVHDEVLARLLKLNLQRSQQESLISKPKKQRTAVVLQEAEPSQQLDLLASIKSDEHSPANFDGERWS